MLKEQFNINVLSDDAVFCTSLATECNKFGFLLSFFDKGDVLNKNDLFSTESLSVSIIDLDDDNLNIINHIIINRFRLKFPEHLMITFISNRNRTYS